MILSDVSRLITHFWFHLITSINRNFTRWGLIVLIGLYRYLRKYWLLEKKMKEKRTRKLPSMCRKSEQDHSFPSFFVNWSTSI